MVQSCGIHLLLGSPAWAAAVCTLLLLPWLHSALSMSARRSITNDPVKCLLGESSLGKTVNQQAFLAFQTNLWFFPEIES